MKNKPVTKESILADMKKCGHPLIKDAEFLEEADKMDDNEFKQRLIEANRKYDMKVDVYDGHCYYGV